MDKEALVLIGAGLGATVLPVFKCGREKGLSVAQALYRHTVFCKDADKIREVIVEDSYRELFEEVFEGEEHSY